MKTSVEIANYALKQFEQGAGFVNIGLNQGTFEIWQPDSGNPPEIIIKRDFYTGFYLDEGMTPAALAKYLEGVGKNLTAMFKSTPGGYLTVTVSARVNHRRR